MINPIFSASALRRMRSFRVIALILLYALLPLIVAVSRGAALSGKILSFDQLTSSHQLNSFFTLFILQFALTCLVAPAMTAGCLTGERERQTMDMLLVTHLGSLRIIMGKWMEAFAFLALLIFSALPMTAMALSLAGLNAMLSLFSTLYLMLIALIVSALGLLCSALCRRTIASTVTAYILLFSLGVLFLIAEISNDIPAALSTSGHAENLPILWYNYLNPISGIGTLMQLLTSTLSLKGWAFACPPETYLALHAISLFVLSLGFSFLSAALLRPRSKPRKRKKTT